MKKYLSLALALIMVLGLFAGCTPSETEPETTNEAVTETGKVDDTKTWWGEADGKTPVKLRFWGAVGEEYGYKAICENFNKAYGDRGLTVEYVLYKNNTDGNTQLETQLSTGDGIDCFIGYGSLTTLEDRGKKNLVCDLSSYLKEMKFDVATEMGNAAAKDVVHEDGTVYGIPSKFDNNGMMLINVDMFKEKGVEIPYTGWTYSEFKAAVEKLTTAETKGVCWYCQGISNAYVYVRGTMGDYYYYTDDSAEKAAFENPIWAEGLDLVKETMEKGWACGYGECKSEKHAVANFLQGECAIFGLFSQIRQCMDTENYPHEFVTALVPCPVPDSMANETELKTMAHMTYTGEYLSVCNQSKHPEQAAEFIRWFLQGGMYPSIMAGRYPLWQGSKTEDIMNTIKSMAGDLVDTKSIEMIFSVDRSNLNKHAPSTKVDSKVTSALKKAWEGYLATGEDQQFKTAAEAMAAAQKEAQAAIDDAIKNDKLH